MIFFLIGFMGCGKTTLAQEVALQNGYSWLDLDECIEKTQNNTIANIFHKVGEAAFRQMESEILSKLIKEYENKTEVIIIACGGGTPCFWENHSKMKQAGKSIYLQQTPAILADRLLETQDTRPLLRGVSAADLPDFIADLLAEREIFYLKASIILPFPSAEKLAALIKKEIPSS
jgi:shikimate kinase